MRKQLIDALWGGVPVKILVAGSKLYTSCPRCKRLVRLNKPILGDLHVCK